MRGGRRRELVIRGHLERGRGRGRGRRGGRGGGRVRRRG